MTTLGELERSGCRPVLTPSPAEAFLSISVPAAMIFAHGNKALMGGNKPTVRL